MQPELFFLRHELFFSQPKLFFSQPKLFFSQPKLYFSRPELYFSRPELCFSQPELFFKRSNLATAPPQAGRQVPQPPRAPVQATSGAGRSFAHSAPAYGALRKARYAKPLHGFGRARPALGRDDHHAVQSHLQKCQEPRTHPIFRVHISSLETLNDEASPNILKAKANAKKPCHSRPPAASSPENEPPNIAAKRYHITLTTLFG